MPDRAFYKEVFCLLEKKPFSPWVWNNWEHRARFMEKMPCFHSLFAALVVLACGCMGLFPDSNDNLIKHWAIRWWEQDLCHTTLNGPAIEGSPPWVCASLREGAVISILDVWMRKTRRPSQCHLLLQSNSCLLKYRVLAKPWMESLSHYWLDDFW